MNTKENIVLSSWWEKFIVNMDVENKYIPQSIRIYNDIILNKKIVFIGKN